MVFTAVVRFSFVNRISRARRLFVTQRFHGVEARREIGRNQSGQRANHKGRDADFRDIHRDDIGRDLRELVNLARENLDVPVAFGREPESLDWQSDTCLLVAGKLI
jgi:hypothetical protein